MTDNWIFCDLKTHKRLTVLINPQPLITGTFQNHCDRVVKNIADQGRPIALFYSGGLDSEFILSVFLRNNIPVIPIVIVTPFNKQELCYAVKFLKQNNLNPIIYQYDNESFFRNSLATAKKLNICNLSQAIQLFLMDELTYLNYNVVTGHGDPYYSELNMSFGEWDFYYLNFYSNHVGSFFLYDYSLHRSMVEEFKYSEPIQANKCKLYHLEMRPKINLSKAFLKYESTLNLPQPLTLQIPVNQYREALQNNQPTVFSSTRL